MPGFDRTGPAGQGALSGWGTGRCASLSDDRAGSFSPAYGYGGGWCRGGRGARRGNGFGGYAGRAVTYRRPLASPVNEKESLQEQADRLQVSLQQIQQRLAELETGE